MEARGGHGTIVHPGEDGGTFRVPAEQVPQLGTADLPGLPLPTDPSG
ncbi:hypothetical protein [Micromonospora sagamiensis]|uniref:Uncharacterized protein n=1 Tax=Micromonospora sagamiensis TaxID=47875 RepID=A0A562WDA8_9ACTN|nr:hypothetical protein [Micromonospora sagamiensis]TWJ28021.1 hypothetical protein JD81_01524 [Micromonospora sagamiensis]BCL13088.1 hypothetical protein GCM10017556_08270 [Micromonospora sagamiensis]